jgi:Zn-dependent protease
LAEFAATALPRPCASCGTQLAARALACPLCKSLVHAARLKTLQSEAAQHEGEGRFHEAVACWQEALALLPAGTRQAAQVADERERVLRLAPAQEAKRPLPQWAKALGPVGVALAFLLGKGKLLLLGLSKLSTLLTMLASFGFYARTWGWSFAAGLVLSIYVHEMGHVAALKAVGLPASAPMFIPGFGAVVRLHARPPDRLTDARIGLAGPLWGLLASLAALGLGQLFPGAPVLKAVGATGAQINLFNLIPIWELDGGRGVRPLSRPQRIGLAALTLAALLVTSEGMLVLVALGLAFRCFEKDAPQEGSKGTLALFAALVVALGVLARVPVPVP